MGSIFHHSSELLIFYQSDLFWRGGLEGLRSLYPRSTQEGVSGEPWWVWTSNFAQCFTYVKAWILQNMSLVAHHSPDKLIFLVVRAPVPALYGYIYIRSPPKYGRGSIWRTMMSWDFKLCTMFELYKGLISAKDEPCSTSQSWEINFLGFPPPPPMGGNPPVPPKIRQREYRESHDELGFQTLHNVLTI